MKWLLLRAQLAPPSARISQRVLGVLIDITDRKMAEERSVVIAREMQHRVKNTLTVVQSLVDQSFRNKGDLEEARLDRRAGYGRWRAPPRLLPPKRRPRPTFRLWSKKSSVPTATREAILSLSSAKKLNFLVKHQSQSL